MAHSAKVPQEKIATGVIDIDVDGKLGGNKCWCTHTFHYQTTDTREILSKKLIEGFDLHMKNMIKANQ